MAVSKKTKSTVGKIVYAFFLLVYAFVLIVIVGKILIDWNKYLNAYENSQYDSLVSRYMDNLKSTEWDSQVAAAVSTMPHPFQTNEECETVIHKMLGETLQYQRDGSRSNATCIVYNVYCNGNSVGQFQIEQDLDAQKNIDIGIFSHIFDTSNLCPWKITGDSFDISKFTFTSSASITVPSNYVVKLNGKNVGSEYITETGIKYDILAKYYEEFPGLPTKVTYSVNNLIFGKLPFEVFDQNGNSFSIDPLKNDSQFMEECSAAEKSEMEAFAAAFAEPYARFTGTKNIWGNYGELKKYVKAGSELLERMDLFIEGGADYMNFNSVVVSNVKTESVYSLGGGFYVINVSYDTTNYADYKTVSESNVKKIIVCKDESGILAVSVE